MVCLNLLLKNIKTYQKNKIRTTTTKAFDLWIRWIWKNVKQSYEPLLLGSFLIKNKT